jgi:putative transposase
MGIKPIRLPPQLPKMNSFAERFVRSVKGECLQNVIFFGEESQRKALTEYINHYHQERNHQGKENLLLFPDQRLMDNEGKIKCRQRLSGMLKYYYKISCLSITGEISGINPL